MRNIFLGGLVLTVLFGSALWALVMLFSESTPTRRPALAEPPPLQAASRVSTVFVPVAIGNNAVRDAMEAQASRNLAGKRESPLSELLGKANVDWNIDRGPLAVVGRAQVLTVTTTIAGQLHVTGQAGNQISQIGDLNIVDAEHDLERAQGDERGPGVRISRLLQAAEINYFGRDGQTG